MKTNAMRCYHPDGIVSSWNHATIFSGKDGRKAVMPDIIDARLLAKLGDTAWETYATTISAEYFGSSKAGNKILIDAHGVGPMATIEGIKKAYSWEYKDKNRNRRGGRISRREFLDLESGKFGEVHITEFEPILRRYEYPFLQILRESQALKEPLLLARFGPKKKAEECIRRHAQFAREWHKEQSQSGDSDPSVRIYHKEQSKSNSDQFIIKMGDASNCSYEHHKCEDDQAIAHLLSIGGLTHVCHEGDESLVCDVHCHEWVNGTALVGIREGKITKIHPGIAGGEELLEQNWKSMMLPANGSLELGFRCIMPFADEWFTQYPKRGERMDTHAPEFLITFNEKIGKPVKFTTTICGYPIFFRYGINEVEKLAPPKANAYSIVSDPWIDGKKRDKHSAMVQFHRVKADVSKRLMQREYLINSIDLCLKLLGV
jgi:hypothetical protein